MMGGMRLRTTGAYKFEGFRSFLKSSQESMKFFFYVMTFTGTLLVVNI